MTEASFLTNQFLIAMPTMADPNFARGVTYVCQHTPEGAMGLMINRLSDYRLGDVLQQMKLDTGIAAVAQTPVYIGGPVNPERGFVLHEAGGEWDSSFRINDELSVTTSRDILVAMAQGKGPDHALVALGYAGWAPGQLEREIVENAWLSVKSTPEILFHTPFADRWEAAAKLLGIDFTRLSSEAGHA